MKQKVLFELNGALFETVKEALEWAKIIKNAEPRLIFVRIDKNTDIMETI